MLLTLLLCPYFRKILGRENCICDGGATLYLTSIHQVR